MFLSVPLEDLGLVFLADGPTLKRILLEEQVKRPVPAAAFRHVKELVIVPVLRKHVLRPFYQDSFFDNSNQIIEHFFKIMTS